MELLFNRKSTLKMMDIPDAPQCRKLKTRRGIKKEITRTKKGMSTCSLGYTRGYYIYLQELEKELDHHNSRKK